MITHGDGGWGVGPRTAIGQRKDGTVLFLVIDGRQPGYSVGATLRDIQNIMYEEGAVIAANLDGGSSSTLYYNGKVINKPADLLGERMIPTASSSSRRAGYEISKVYWRLCARYCRPGRHLYLFRPGLVCADVGLPNRRDDAAGGHGRRYRNERPQLLFL